jgi:threonine 3-dehydrogenase
MLDLIRSSAGAKLCAASARLGVRCGEESDGLQTAGGVSGMSGGTIPAEMLVPSFLGAGEIGFVTKPVPDPESGQLLIQVRANALCGSERWQFFDGSEVTPGHEAAGVVVKGGPQTRTPPGTPGVIYLMDFCGECRSCTLGFTNQCLNKRGDVGFNRDGGYGPYVLINENVFFPIGDEVTLSEATMLLDVMGTTRHAIKRGLLMREDVRSLGIAGAGPIGLGTLAMAKILIGQELPVVISDLSPYRLALAESLGGSVIDLREKTLAEGLSEHGLDAVDLAIDTSGKGAARYSYVEVLSKRGVLVCAGHGEGLSLDVSRDLIEPERAVLGSEYFCYGELESNLEILREHLPYLSRIITHRFALRDIQEAFELFFRGETGKVLVEQ